MGSICHASDQKKQNIFRLGDFDDDLASQCLDSFLGISADDLYTKYLCPHGIPEAYAFYEDINIASHSLKMQICELIDT